MASKALNEIRLANTLRLFESFCEVIAPGNNDLRGLEKAFALNLGISPSYWAQIKSPKRIKGIGPNLARQFERKLTMPVGWLDEAHGDDALVPLREPPAHAIAVETLEEKEYLEAALALFRENPIAARERLK